MTNKQQQTGWRRVFNLRVGASVLFWSWNMIFLAFMLLGFAPQILPEMIAAVQADQFPASFLLYALILTLIPVLAVLLGFIFLRREPYKLLALGYGLEGPLMLMLALRFFGVRDMTWPVLLLMVSAGLGMMAYFWHLFDRKIDERGEGLGYLRIIGLTLLLFVGLYISLWIAFYVIPLAIFLLRSLIETLIQLPGAIIDWVRDFDLSGWRYIEWQWLPFSILGFILFIYTATLFVGMPIMVSVFYIRAWWHSLRTSIERYSALRPLALSTTVFVLALFFFVRSNQQPQHAAFALLEEPPTSIIEAETLLQQEQHIRAGLLNAYLAPFRYFSAVGEVRHISEMYADAFNTEPENALSVQELYEIVARPVLYEPVGDYEAENRWESPTFRDERTKADELYQTFFDEPIIEGEKEAVVTAVRATWSIDQSQAAWQAVDDREIHLIQQELNITEQGDWADIELYEVYQNQTTQRQEVVYYFSLPESAVVTGVWLGNSPNREERDVYRVAPRGAAQAVYRNEVRRNFDPALVEQIGPRQYRLRIFPIEGGRMQWSDQVGERPTIEEGKALHMWLTWRVLANENAWPMPHLAEKRNVYWDRFSERLVNGEPMEADDDTWLPSAIPATSDITPMAHQMDFPNGESVLVRPVSADDVLKLPYETQLALVLDRSRSMIKHEAEVSETLNELKEVSQGHQIDLYLTASPYRGENASRTTLDEVNPDTMMYYGGQNAAELLAQFDALKADDTYDAILVLTDGSGYELGESEIEIPAADAPIWMVHLGGDLPLGYDDDTLEAIQASGGGVTGDIDDAFTRLALALDAQKEASSPNTTVMADIIDGYIWLTLPTEQVGAQSTQISTNSDEQFGPFAARRLILSEMYRQRSTIGELDTLDQLHQIAIEQSIVTPYSSMIVLINERQEKLLDELEKQGDRFEREHEEIGETEGITVTGVPEPEEWLLLALGAAMLAWYWRKSRQVLT